MTLTASTGSSDDIDPITPKHKSKKIALSPARYEIESHWGIGDEREEYGETRERPKHNLSGSCHELRIFFGEQVYRVLIDVWAYQWSGKIVRDITQVSNWVDAVVITHPHMDHIGDLPRAFVDDAEFAGRVYATPATRDAAEISLIDAANILAREFANKQYGYVKVLEDIGWALLSLKINGEKKGKAKVPRNKSNGNRMRQTWENPNRAGEINKANAILAKYKIDPTSTISYKTEMEEFAPKKPAYDIEDVERTIAKIETHTIEDGWKELIPGKLAFRFYNAGHIIGSVSVLFRITIDGKIRNVLFSGDLGSYKWDFHPTGLPVPPHNLPIDTVLIESTYGNKIRSEYAKWLADFQENIKNDLAKHKQIIISTFAMDRSQIMLNILIQMKKRWDIDADIILDSPSGAKHTMNYLKHSKKLDPTIVTKHVPSIHKTLYDDFVAAELEKLTEFVENIDPSNHNYTIADRKNKWSVFADKNKPKIIITSSGMAEGGMVISHLEKNLTNPEVAFYFPGYLVPGSLGYALASESQPGGQQKNVKIAGKGYEVKARIKQFNWLSGHGDEEDLQTWLWAMKLRKGSNIRIVHGDINGSSLALKHTLERSGKYPGVNTIVPWLNEVNTFPIAKSNLEKKKWAAKKPTAKLKK